MLTGHENRGCGEGVFGENGGGDGGPIRIEKSHIQAAFLDAGDRCADLKTLRD
jgi:hypothetical protein